MSVWVVLIPPSVPSHSLRCGSLVQTKAVRTLAFFPVHCEAGIFTPEQKISAHLTRISQQSRGSTFSWDYLLPAENSPTKYQRSQPVYMGTVGMFSKRSRFQIIRSSTLQFHVKTNHQNGKVSFWLEGVCWWKFSKVSRKQEQVRDSSALGNPAWINSRWMEGGCWSTIVQLTPGFLLLLFSLQWPHPLNSRPCVNVWCNEHMMWWTRCVINTKCNVI